MSLIGPLLGSQDPVWHLVPPRGFPQEHVALKFNISITPNSSLSFPPRPSSFSSVFTRLFKTLSGLSSAFVFYHPYFSACASSYPQLLSETVQDPPHLGWETSRKGPSSATELLECLNNPGYATIPIVITSSIQWWGLGQSLKPESMTIQGQNQVYWENSLKMLLPHKDLDVFLNPPFYLWFLLQSPNHIIEGHQC